MSNPYYNHDDSVPPPQSRGVSLNLRAEFDKVAQGFDNVARLGLGFNENTVNLTDGDSITWDLADGQMAFLTLSTQRLVRVLNNPLHLSKGKFTLIVTQNPAGNQVFSGFGSAFVFADDATPNLAANAVTIYQCMSDGVKVYVAKHAGATAGSPVPSPPPPSPPPPPPAGAPLTAAFASAVNLSGMEWAQPGVRYGTSTYPDINYTVPRAADLAYLATLGVTKVRLNILWEFLQPLLYDSPANSTVVSGYDSSLGTYTKGGFWEPYAQYIDKVLDAAQTAGILVILDVHNYCRYKDFIYQADGSVLGWTRPTDKLFPPYTNDGSQVESKIFALVNPKLSQTHFTDLWSKMATRWKTHAALGGYSLMNEPHDMPAAGTNVPWNNPFIPGNTQDFTIWPAFAQSAVSAIRSIDGNTPIYVGGNNYQNPIEWATINPGFPLTGARIIYDFHLYLDAHNSGARFDWDIEAALTFSAGEGGVPISSATGTNRIAYITAWAAAHGNPPLACTELGLPIERTAAGALDTRWLTAAAATLSTLKSHNIETHVWMGGNHWGVHAYPINFVPQLLQGATLAPMAAGLMNAQLGTNVATIFDEGGQWSSGGAAVSVKVQARGNLTSPVTLTLASDNGGSFSKTTLTLAAGVNSEDTYTFTPVSNAVTTISYTRSGGGQKPPDRVVYSLSDPVAYASTDLAKAAKAIMAKYGASCWLAKDALKEYLTPVAAAVGDYVRGISDSGSGSTLLSPMEMINWLNQDAGSLRSTQIPGVFATEPTSSKPALDFTTYGRRGLASRHLAPVVASGPNIATDDDYEHPACTMPFNLTDAHFMVCAFMFPSTSTFGNLMSAQNIRTPAHTALQINNGAVQFDQWDSASPPVVNTMTSSTVLSPNALHTASCTSAQGAQKMRQDGVQVGSSFISYTTSPFDTASVGSGYYNFYPQDAAQHYGFAYIMGPGNPSDQEITVLENYAKTFGTAGGGALSGGEALLTTQFGSGNAGWWGDNRSFSEFSTDSSSNIPPTTWSGDTIARWKNHGANNGHDFLETNPSNKPILGVDGGGWHYVNGYHGNTISGAGGSTTAFYACFVMDWQAYYGTMFSDQDVANHGVRLQQSADLDEWVFSAGKGSSLVSAVVGNGLPYFTSGIGKVCMDCWFDGTNIAVRMNKGTPGTTALGAGAITAGNANMELFSHWGDTDAYGGNTYAGVILKNYCPNSTDRDAIATFIASLGGLTI